MALNRPALNNIYPFDATKQNIFTFTSSGSSSQITGNILTIQRNDTLEVVYSQEQITFAYSHTLNANVLQNGISYIATIQTIGINGEKSMSSAAVLFVCLAEPTFRFNNMPVGNTITGNSYQFDVLYNQLNGEQLNSVQFNLYSLSMSLISTSGMISDISGVPVTISYLFSGFDNGAEYYVEAVGQTVRGLNVSTGAQLITIAYSSEQLYSKFQLTNNCKGGYITIKSIVTPIDGTSNPQNPIYIDNDSVDLRQNGSWVGWAEGYSVSGDFIAKIWGTQFVENKQIISLQNNNANISVYYMSDDANNIYAIASVNQYGLTYIIQSEVISAPSDNEQIFVMLTRINNIYSINIQNLGVQA